jgi:hypothetical protein
VSGGSDTVGATMAVSDQEFGLVHGDGRCTQLAGKEMFETIFMSCKVSRHLCSYCRG